MALWYLHPSCADALEHWHCIRSILPNPPLVDLFMFELYRPSSSSDRTSPYAVYPTSLFSLGLGYALWYPEPHETGESQIGDVGYVHEGAFIRLFNINLSKSEHGVTFWKKAFENAAPLVDSEDLFVLDKRSRVISDGPYQSRGVKKKETRGSASV